MKRLILLAILLILIPINAHAVSLNSLQNNPSQYVKICDISTATVYLEPSTINIVRSSHPYYTLQAKIYTVIYENSVILKNSYTVNYDYNRSLFALVLTKRGKTPNCTEDELFDFVMSEAKKDSGITAGSKTDCAYDLKGNYLYKGTLPVHSSKAEYGTVLHATANYIYYYYTQCKEYFFR